MVQLKVAPQKAVVELKAGCQIRILKALSTAKGPWNRSLIAARAKTHPTNETNLWGIGQEDPDKRRSAELKSGRPSLLTLGLVNEVRLDIDGKEEACYEINEEGRRALAAIEANPAKCHLADIDNYSPRSRNPAYDPKSE